MGYRFYKALVVFLCLSATFDSQAGGGYFRGTPILRMDTGGNTPNAALNKVSNGWILIPGSNDGVWRAYLSNSNWNKAVVDFGEAILRLPNESSNFFYRAGAFIMLGDYDKAIGDFSEIIRLEPGNVLAHANRGGLYGLNGEVDKAITDYNECLRLDPKCSSCYMVRASALMEKSEFEKAINDWNEGLRLAPGDAQALRMRGYCFTRKGEFNKAVQDYKEAIRLDPTNDLAFNGLGWLRATCPVAEMRNGKEAVAAATKSCELANWMRSEYLDTLAAAYAESADFKSAVKYETQALGMNGLSESDRAGMNRRLSLYLEQKPYHESKGISP